MNISVQMALEGEASVVRASRVNNYHAVAEQTE
jgi:hypothetical protein